MNHSEKIIGEKIRDPQQNLPFAQSTTPTHTPTLVVEAFNNEYHKTWSSDNVDQDKMTALKTRIRIIKGADLYDQATKMCLVPNMVVPKIFVFLNSLNILDIKYTGTQCQANF